MILLVGAVGSVWAFHDAKSRDAQKAEDEFHRRVAILHSLTQSQIEKYQNALLNLQMIFPIDGGMSQAEFARVAQALKEHNLGVTAFEWVPLVTAKNRAAAEARLPLRPNGQPGEFTEHNAAGQVVRAADRPEYYPITYAEPLAGNERAIGFDLHVAQSSTFVERARETRQLVLSSQFRLVQEEASKWGLVMICPVYGASPNSSEPGAFRGFVQSIFRVQDMLESTRVQTWRSDSILDMMFIDDSEPNPALRVLYYRSSNSTLQHPAVPTERQFRTGLYEEHSLMIGGRTWKILYRPRPGWLASRITPLPLVRTAGVLSITLLLAGLVHILGRRSADIAHEVTERTAELNESRRLLDSLLHALPGMAYRCQYDSQLKVIYASEGATVLTGYTPDDFIWGRVHFRQLIHPEDVARVRSVTQAALQAHRDVEIEYRLLTRDHTEKWVLSRGRGVYAENGSLLFLEGLAIDITASKQAEADKLAIERKLLDGQKLESLGLMAGGIAHDFNNILTGILGNANLARFKVPADSPVVTHLTKIELGTARAAELCQQMLAYSGKSSFHIEAVDLSQLVNDTLPLLHTTLASRARLQLNLSPQPAVVLADATQLRQIVMNLVINAADAITERPGEIQVTTGHRRFETEFLRAAQDGDTLPPGEYVFIQVRDNGCGMAAETLARIFDPFFTTKFAGRGLGLAAVRGIVRGHHGALHVVSAPGQGSTFTLILPPSTQPVSLPTPVPFETRKYSGKALVIDDEAPVREATAGLLATFGFTPLTADNGAVGLAQFCTGPAGFTIVLLDLTMPGMNGEETLAALRAIAPTVRVLLISGYSENDRASRLAGAGRIGFLQKPFTREKLEIKLRELLG
ncbi:MAG: CHASE domain-containing protein [Opitutaceae bacterium]